jgi:hypothetical protein
MEAHDDHGIVVWKMRRPDGRADRSDRSDITIRLLGIILKHNSGIKSEPLFVR